MAHLGQFPRGTPPWAARRPRPAARWRRSAPKHVCLSSFDISSFILARSVHLSSPLGSGLPSQRRRRPRAALRGARARPPPAPPPVTLLAQAQSDALRREAPHEQLRGLVADAISAEEGSAPLRLDGAPLELVQDGLRYAVRVNDVAGLVDLYQAPPAVLALLGAPGRRITERRAVLKARLPPGAEYADTVQTLTRLGLDAAERAELAGLVTQDGRRRRINSDVAPDGIRRAAAGLPAAMRRPDRRKSWRCGLRGISAPTASQSAGAWCCATIRT